MAKSQDSEPRGAAEASSEAKPANAAAKRPRAPKPRDRADSPSTLNFIQPADVPINAKVEPGAPRKGVPRQEPAQPGGLNAVERPLDTESIPAAVRQRYVQDGNAYLFPSGERAFEDHGRRLSTPSENTTIVRDLIAVAYARGWNEIKIGGTKTFRQEAWREAKLAGLEVIGYKPTRAEQALLIRALSRREAAPQTDDSLRSTAELFEDERRVQPKIDGPLITGRVLDHKAARDPLDPEERMSYYMRLKTPRGEREVWHPDLGRAIRQSLTDVQIGDEIGVRAIPIGERQAKEQVREDGSVQALDRLVVEQRRFFNDRVALAKTFRDASLRPSDGYRRHPVLKGSYLEFQAAKLKIEEKVKDPEERERLAARVREGMAAAIERGEPLIPVRMRDRAPESPKKTSGIPDPEHLLTR